MLAASTAARLISLIHQFAHPAPPPRSLNGSGDAGAERVQPESGSRPAGPWPCPPCSLLLCSPLHPPPVRQTVPQTVALPVDTLHGPPFVLPAVASYTLPHALSLQQGLSSLPGSPDFTHLELQLEGALCCHTARPAPAVHAYGATALSLGLGSLVGFNVSVLQSSLIMWVVPLLNT